MKNSLAMHIPCKNPRNQTNVHSVRCAQVLRNVSILLLLLGPAIFKCTSQLLVCIFWGTPWCRILHISLGAAQDVAQPGCPTLCLPGQMAVWAPGPVSGHELPALCYPSQGFLSRVFYCSGVYLTDVANVFSQISLSKRSPRVLPVPCTAFITVLKAFISTYAALWFILF